MSLSPDTKDILNEVLGNLVKVSIAGVSTGILCHRGYYGWAGGLSMFLLMLELRLIRARLGIK